MNINIEATPHSSVPSTDAHTQSATHENSLAENTSRGRITAFFGSAIVVVAALVIATLFFTGTIGGNSNDTNGTSATGPATNSENTNGQNTGDNTGGTGSDTPGEEAPGSREVLPDEMNGQQAINALGDDIDRVAELNGKTTEELKELLLRDNTVHISKFGYILYKDTMRPRNTQ